MTIIDDNNSLPQYSYMFDVITLLMCSMELLRLVFEWLVEIFEVRKFSTESGIRTHDPQIKLLELSQLSYLGPGSTTNSK